MQKTGIYKNSEKPFILFRICDIINRYRDEDLGCLPSFGITEAIPAASARFSTKHMHIVIISVYLNIYGGERYAKK